MDFITACFEHSDAFFKLGAPCLWGWDVPTIIGVLGLSVLGVLGAVLKFVGRKSKTVWKNLTARADYPLFDNLDRQPEPQAGFVGRAKLIEEIQRRIDRGQGTLVQATISGAGGFGKTALALETARQSKGHFEGVWVLRAATVEGLQASLASLAPRFNIETQARPPEDVAQETLDAIVARKQPWLLVYDNADDPSVMQGYQRDASTLSLIVTSRSTDFDVELQPLKVDELSPEDARDLLDGLFRKRGHQIAPDQLAELAKRVGYWPLGLVGAAGFLRKQSSPEIALYLTQFDLEKINLKGMGYDDSRLNFAAVLRVSTDPLTPEDRAVLSVLSYLNPDDLWPEMLAEMAVDELREPLMGEPLPQIWQQIGAEPERVQASFDRLAEVSLIYQEDGRWRMHRMIGEIWRAMLEPAERVEAGETAARLLNLKMPYEVEDHNKWDLCQRLMDHGRVLLALQVQSVAAARFFNQIGSFAFYRNPQRSDCAFADGAVQVKEVLEPESESLAASLNNQAMFLKQFGDLDEAMGVFERVRKIRAALPEVGPEHPSYAATLNNIAGVWRDKTNFAKALPLLEDARRIYEARLGPDHPSTVNQFRNIGQLLLEWAQAGAKGADPEELKAREAAMKETALARAKDGLGPLHPDTAIDYHNAALHWQAEDLTKAFDLMARAAVARTTLLPPGHSWTLGSLNGCFIYGNQLGMSPQDILKTLPRVWSELVEEHREWGAAKLRALFAREGIAGEISQETVAALSEKLRAKVAQMQADDAPAQAWSWVEQEASYALNAMQYQPDPQAFQANLDANLAVLKAQ